MTWLLIKYKNGSQRLVNLSIVTHIRIAIDKRQEKCIVFGIPAPESGSYGDEVYVDQAEIWVPVAGVEKMELVDEHKVLQILARWSGLS